jgi:hypothetical protein
MELRGRKWQEAGKTTVGFTKYCHGDQVKEDEMEKMRNVHEILVGKPEGRYHSENNIKMDLREIGWMHVVQDRDQWRTLVNTVMNLRVP